MAKGNFTVGGSASLELVSGPGIAYALLFKTLRKHNAGSVITNVAGRRDCARVELTTLHALIRFVGNDLHPTDYTRANNPFSPWLKNLSKEFFKFA